MNAVINMLMQNLMSKNPSGYKLANDLMKNGGDINGIATQILGSASAEQRQQILNQARSYGCPSSILSKFQNLK